MINPQVAQYMMRLQAMKEMLQQRNMQMQNGQQMQRPPAPGMQLPQVSGQQVQGQLPGLPPAMPPMQPMLSSPRGAANTIPRNLGQALMGGGRGF